MGGASVPDDPSAGEAVRLEKWSGPWPDDDKDANFKNDVALYSKLDPLATITVLSESTEVPVGAICRFILAKWASAGAEALLTLGPTAITRLAEAVDRAEEAGTDAARLEAYQEISAQLSWLRYPIENPDIYP